MYTNTWQHIKKTCLKNVCDNTVFNSTIFTLNYAMLYIIIKKGNLIESRSRNLHLLLIKCCNMLTFVFSVNLALAMAYNEPVCIQSYF